MTKRYHGWKLRAYWRRRTRRDGMLGCIWLAIVDAADAQGRYQ